MLKNPFARTAEGTVVHIDHADDALGPFSCAGCEQPMSRVSESKPYSRKGSDKVIQKRGYFRHKQQEECSTGLETSLHLWAKLIIEKAMTVGLPEHQVTYRNLSREFDTPWVFTAVMLEEWQDGIRPDIVLYHPDGRLNVEIRVTHAVDDAKTALLRERSQSCIEIDLAGFDFDNTPGDELRDAILTYADRSWIVHQMEDQRVHILQMEWHKLAEVEGIKLRSFINSIPTLITNAMRAQHEDEIQDLGHEPFIGRDIPGQHWFVAPPRNWQHTALKVYLHPYAGKDGIYRFDRPPNPVSGDIHVFRNDNLPGEVEPEILLAAGLNTDSYGSHCRSVETYFRMLCEEADIEGAHPIARRIVSYGSNPGTMVINPERDGYIRRRNQLCNAYIEAGRRRRLDSAAFRTWYKTPLSRSGATPRKICIEGGGPHAKLVAYLNAIVNMLDGGWPVQHLLGVEEAWLRDKRAREYNKPLGAGGGPHPYHQDTHRVCASTRMMREGMPAPHILIAMAEKLHKNTEAASSFLNMPNSLIEGQRPIEFVVDIPTLQRCIALMPIDPSFVKGNGRHSYMIRYYKRIW